MKISRLGHFAICLSLLTLSSLALASLPAGSYHQLKKIPLGVAPGGKEYFDYITVDSPARRVYLTHGTEVKVVDADSGAVVGTRMPNPQTFPHAPHEPRPAPRIAQRAKRIPPRSSPQSTSQTVNGSSKHSSESFS